MWYDIIFRGCNIPIPDIICLDIPGNERKTLEEECKLFPSIIRNQRNQNQQQHQQQLLPCKQALKIPIPKKESKESESTTKTAKFAMVQTDSKNSKSNKESKESESTTTTATVAIMQTGAKKFPFQ